MLSDALWSFRDLVPFVQFKKRQKQIWRSVIYSTMAGFNLQIYWK